MRREMEQEAEFDQQLPAIGAGEASLRLGSLLERIRAAEDSLRLLRIAVQVEPANWDASELAKRVASIHEDLKVISLPNAEGELATTIRLGVSKARDVIMLMMAELANLTQIAPLLARVEEYGSLREAALLEATDAASAAQLLTEKAVEV